MPLGSIVIITIYPPEKRGAAMGTMGIAMILAPAIGPTLSGYIVQNYHWNVMFYGMFIIGIIAILVGFIWFKLYQYTTNPKADIPGIIFSTIGFGALLYGFSEAGNKGWGSVGDRNNVCDWYYLYYSICNKRIKNESTNVEFRSIEISNIYTNNSN